MTEIPEAVIGDLLSEPLHSNQIWIDFVDAAQQVFGMNIEGPLKQLEEIRYLKAGTDLSILKLSAAMLGFDVSQDILEFSANSLLKIVPQLGYYPDNNGTNFFTRFIDMLLNASTQVDALYTRDYRNFYVKPYGTMITEGGEWYKTTHVEVTMALFITNEVKQAVNTVGTTFLGRIMEVFYAFAPIALVIKRFYFEYKETVNLGVCAHVATGTAKRFARI